MASGRECDSKREEEKISANPLGRDPSEMKRGTCWDNEGQQTARSPKLTRNCVHTTDLSIS